MHNVSGSCLGTALWSDHSVVSITIEGSFVSRKLSDDDVAPAASITRFPHTTPTVLLICRGKTVDFASTNQQGVRGNLAMLTAAATSGYCCQLGHS